MHVGVYLVFICIKVCIVYVCRCVFDVDMYTSISEINPLYFHG